MPNPDQFFALFQQFRPMGIGVESVFNGIPHAQQYLQRLQRIYQATQQGSSNQDMYFIVRAPPQITDAQLIAHGQQLLTGLRALSMIIEDDELTAYLATSQQVQLVSQSTLDPMADANLLVLESIGDWLIGVSNHADPIPQMREAFYSVACDFFLMHYLQWPYFQHLCPTDVFAPYFELWRHAARGAFNAEGLTIARTEF